MSRKKISKQKKREKRRRPTKRKEHALDRILNQLAQSRKFKSELLEKRVSFNKLPKIEEEKAIRECLRESARRNRVIAEYKVDIEKIKQMSDDEALEIALQVIQEKLAEMEDFQYGT